MITRGGDYFINYLLCGYALHLRRVFYKVEPIEAQKCFRDTTTINYQNSRDSTQLCMQVIQWSKNTQIRMSYNDPKIPRKIPNTLLVGTTLTLQRPAKSGAVGAVYGTNWGKIPSKSQSSINWTKSRQKNLINEVKSSAKLRFYNFSKFFCSESYRKWGEVDNFRRIGSHKLLFSLNLFKTT